MSTTHELKRCPWCNGHDLSLDVTLFSYNIKCFDCGCLGPRASTIARCVRRWNGVVSEHEEGWTSLIVFATRRELNNHNRNDVKEVEL